MEGVRHEAHMEDMINAYNISVDKFNGKTTMRIWRRCENRIND
jgi:hypothetical protein